MDFKISDDQRAIREAVASICKRFDLASRRNARAEWLKRKIDRETPVACRRFEIN